MYARRAIKARKHIKACVCLRLARSQSTGVGNGTCHQIRGLSTQTITPQDAPEDHILDLVNRTLGPRKYEIWKKAYQRKDDTQGKKRRIGVLDLSQPGSSSLIGALIGTQDTKSSLHEALELRWTSLPESSSRLLIRVGGKIAKFGSILEVPSESLAKLNAEVLEVRDPEYAAELLRAQLVVLVVQSGTHLNLPSLKHKKDSVVLLEHTGVAQEAGYTLHGGQHSNYVVFDRAKPQEAVSHIYARLSSINFETMARSSKQSTILGMLDECYAHLQASSHNLAAIQTNAAAFEAQESSLLQGLNAKFNAIDLPAEMQVEKAHLYARIAAFSRFRFWEMDDFSEELQTYVIASYGVDLERKLEYLAGSMAAVQERIHRITNDYLTQASGDLDSATLINKIHQLEASDLPIPPASFTTPILNRRRQLASIATPHMQSLYLRRVYTAMAAMPIFTGAPALLWANGMLDASVALPSAILGLLLCARHISRAWEKVRTKWLADYDRIQTGLSEDVQKIVREILDKRLRKIPLAALEGSAQLISQREETIKALAAEVEAAKKEHS